MRLVRSLAFVGAVACAQSAFSNGFTGEAARDGSGQCIYPSSIVFTKGTVPATGAIAFYYDITTAGSTQSFSYQNEGSFWYGLTCDLPAASQGSQHVTYKIKTTSMFPTLSHIGHLAKMAFNYSSGGFLAEGPIFWGDTQVYPQVQYERFSYDPPGNWPGVTQINEPDTLGSSTDYPMGDPSLVDGVVYDVDVWAYTSGVKVTVKDPSGNVRASLDSGGWTQKVLGNAYGMGFFSFPSGGYEFPMGARLEVTDISVTNYQ
jgi:hypothetical protein